MTDFMLASPACFSTRNSSVHGSMALSTRVLIKRRLLPPLDCSGTRGVAMTSVGLGPTGPTTSGWDTITFLGLPLLRGRTSGCTPDDWSGCGTVTLSGETLTQVTG